MLNKQLSCFTEHEGNPTFVSVLEFLQNKNANRMFTFFVVDDYEVFTLFSLDLISDLLILDSTGVMFFQSVHSMII